MKNRTLANNNTGLIVFSRFNSNRLYGKALRKIGNRPLLGRVIDLAKLVKNDLPIIVATSNLKSDDVIESFAVSEGVKVFRGSQKNVLKRAVDCCDFYGFKRFARICGDRPFYSPKLINTLIRIHIKFNLDLATNNLVKTFPNGLTSEVVSVECLKRILEEITDKDDCEHVTRFIYRNQKKFKIKNVRSPISNIKKFNLAVDTEEDLKRSDWMVKKLPTRKEFDLKVLIGCLKEYKKI